MTESAQQPIKKVIVFALSDKEYAIEIDVVQGIERIMGITRVPGTPSYVKGVINLRGVVTPVIDLRERFGLETKELDDSTRIIIVSLETYDVGLVVDAANDIVDVPVHLIEAQPEVVGSISSEFIAGVAKVESRLFVLLELEKVLEPINRVESS